jgi:hypothetical protein
VRVWAVEFEEFLETEPHLKLINLCLNKDATPARFQIIQRPQMSLFL